MNILSRTWAYYCCISTQGSGLSAVITKLIAVFDEWSRLNRMLIRDDSLRALPLEELYSRALLHFHYQHFNILLLMALTQASAMDSMLADCGAPGLLPFLKQETAKGRMLLFLVGHAWITIRKQDPSRINAESLVHKWVEIFDMATE